MSILRPARFGSLLFGLILGLTRGGLQAQSTLDPLYVLTGSGTSALLSTNAMLDLRGVPQPGGLGFAFGFTTPEPVAPGGFFDSFTISVGDANQPGAVAIFVVVDANGVAVAPITPGTVFVHPATVSLTPISFPASLPAFAQQWAYQALIVLPAELADKQVDIYFDLFDNGDNVLSLGWASGAFVIPEPSFVLIGLLGLASLRLRSRGRRG